MVGYMCLHVILILLLHLEYGVFFGYAMCDHKLLFIAWICVVEDIERNEIYFN